MPKRSARGEGLVSHTEHAEGTEERRSGKCPRGGHRLRRSVPTATGSFGARTPADGDPAGGMAAGNGCFQAPSRLPPGFLKAPSRLPSGSLRGLRVLRERKEPALPVRGGWVHPRGFPKHPKKTAAPRMRSRGAADGRVRWGSWGLGTTRSGSWPADPVERTGTVSSRSSSCSRRCGRIRRPTSGARSSATRSRRRCAHCARRCRGGRRR